MDCLVMMLAAFDGYCSGFLGLRRPSATIYDWEEERRRRRRAA